MLRNKPVCLELSILDLSKTVMHDFWYDYVKPKYGENAKLCYMDTDSFIVHVKTDDVFKDNGEDVETRFDTSKFEMDKSLPKGKNKKVIRLMKGELGGKIMKDIVGKITSENLLNEIKQIIFLYRAKEITKIVYDNKMNSITV